MKSISQSILYKKTGNDEAYTPIYGVIPIIEFIPKNKIVWCPFDKEDSNFVKVISKTNEVVYSHIDYGQDFFNYEPDNWDIIISNPPFKNKRKIFERALSFNKPIALLMTCTWLNDKYSKWVFKEANRSMELLMFDKRIHFEQQGNVRKSTTFSSAYFCSDFLPKNIILKEINEV